MHGCGSRFGVTLVVESVYYAPGLLDLCIDVSWILWVTEAAGALVPAPDDCGVRPRLGRGPAAGQTRRAGDV